MDVQGMVGQMMASKEWFDRSSRCLTEADSTTAPGEGQFTAAQQVAHVAQTVDWFVEGAFRPQGFDMDFETMAGEVLKVESLDKAREWLDRSFAAAAEVIGSKSMEELSVPLPAGPVMGGMPRMAIVGAIGDHTAHHRGVLTVYSRLAGHVPAMPYMEM